MTSELLIENCLMGRRRRSSPPPHFFSRHELVHPAALTVCLVATELPESSAKISPNCLNSFVRVTLDLPGCAEAVRFSQKYTAGVGQVAYVFFRKITALEAHFCPPADVFGMSGVSVLAGTELRRTSPRPV